MRHYTSVLANAKHLQLFGCRLLSKLSIADGKLLKVRITNRSTDDPHGTLL